ncbi:Plasmodium exported protein, unknown function [Plasmodium knowlesi strain H]|uniref:Uncharacterized protein n=3 Tax=Plasmodium knowlesi TaxID=5850 RepID=A0A5K1UVU6_PLAKH|nr:uncharacterized protein PKNH_1000400 [Plasmodium knowlesi strain H]OTN66946.1 Uncharacterized protein PKNOH_S07438000 [Plasmodium knowlesi]CAA9988515.1 Plasmodium exported protein, unknown function [Plasmodium knowlesi strain H]SBO21280.1 Plasmodium exported protein, unknown function [Plasmodium knowlesi strain H]SBO21733.1 Plasmodium exported protein, unknown function [Plasmodium knowlesi strain H]VVS77989.1 Plasmodium exported protein, unknown function [Plasmodium knowlesi strain H]|eukprot:XP_002259490.1 [Plasmodium knowlesi strain H]
MISLRKLPLFIFVVYSWQCSDHYVITLGTLWSGELGTKRSDNTTTMRISRSLMGEMDIGTHQQDRNGSFRKEKLMRSVYGNNYHGGGYLGRHHPYYDNSMDSLITNSSMDSTSMGSCSSLFTGNSTFTDSSMNNLITDRSMDSVTDRSMESLTDNSMESPFDRCMGSLTDRSMDSITDNSMESPFDRSIESLFPKRRDFHGDYPTPFVRMKHGGRRRGQIPAFSGRTRPFRNRKVHRYLRAIFEVPILLFINIFACCLLLSIPILLLLVF